MRIGVLGGTFDPVHNGHVALAKAALKEAQLGKLIVMPAEVQPFKLGKKITEDYHRVEMLRLAFEKEEAIEVSEYEVDNDCVSYTFETLCYLRRLYPGNEIFFVLGTDSFLTLDTWFKGKDILENFSFAVSSRPGYREEELDATILLYQEKYRAETIKLHDKMPNVSSTEIKERLEKGLSIAEMVPEAVERYIDEEGLYK